MWTSARCSWLMAVPAALALAACSRAKNPSRKPKPELASEAGAPSASPTASIDQRLPVRAGALSWLAFGGGSDPLSNQISIAQDMELATSSFAGPGLTLFASGASSLVAVQRTKSEPNESEAVFDQLARLLGPPGAREVEYRAAPLRIDAPATREHVLDALRSAVDLSRNDAGVEAHEPLLVFAAGHGEHGSVPRENALALWGGWSANVEDFAELLDGPERVRPTRFVITACYGGGFAELAFVHANPQDGTRPPEHCGLFAAPADDESSGCDPNPNRREQESYTIHFLHALRGQDREGHARTAEIDRDADGRVSLREAHAWARIHSHSFDIPTSTSERYLREHTRSFEEERGRNAGDVDLEERAVVEALASELELTDERSARAKLRELDDIFDEVSDQVDEVQHDSDDAYYALRIALLERWPLLDHSWDPRAHVLATQEAPQIVALLSESELAQANHSASRELDEALAQQDAVRVTRARVRRLVRSYETLRLASALERRGGTRWEHYQALRACERYVPALRTP